MSGLIVHKDSPRFVPVGQSLEKLCFVDWTRKQRGSAGSFEFGVTWVNDSAAPVYSGTGLGVSVAVLGSLYGHDDVRLDRNLSRLAADYRKNGASVLTEFNGMGAVVLFDHRLDACFIVTDRMGFFPLLVACADEPGGTAVGTHADLLAAAYRDPLELDEVSMAEFLSAGAATPPHTYYRDIRQLESAGLYRWDKSGFRKERTYWTLAPKPDWSASTDRFAGRLAEAIRHAVHVRLRNAGGKAGLLLSGGWDSRALLFSSGDPASDFIAITFCDRVNLEIRCARMLAQLADVEHTILRRDAEYYGRIAVRAVKLCSGMWDWSQTHTLGFAEELHRLSPHLTLSGLYFDLLFKGNALDTRLQSPWRFLPGKPVLGPANLAWYHGLNYSLENSPVRDEVDERMSGFCDGLVMENMTDLDRMRLEFRRLSPISSGPGIGFSKTLMRTVPYDLITPDAQVLEVFRTIPPAVKLDRSFFPKMVKKIDPRALTVPDANTGCRFGENALGAAFRVAFRGLARRLRKVLGVAVPPFTLATETSWINWYFYVSRSAVMRALWREVRDAHSERIVHLLGYDPFAESMETLARDYPLFRRILTLGLWLKYRIR